MDLGLAGKVVVITGASRGIGRAAALGFADEGAKLAICARGAAALEATAKEIRALGASVHARTADVGKAAELDAFLESARAEFGRIDVLVNNSSGFGISDDEAGWKVSFDVDVMASVRASWKVVPWMTEQGGGVIVHISSTSALEAGSPPSYAAAKAALISHSKTLAVALAPAKIRVLSIAPGSIEFPGGVWEQIKNGNRPYYDAIRASIPWGRLGTAEEVASAIVFAASPRASWITGVVISVDGGQHKGNL
ncbi:MAG: SDR family oxidoreductase [Deltaproteobacteria bacterium]|nr:SDR family oxidoreductase [Deltaproteobacteria bacterium]